MQLFRRSIRGLPDLLLRCATFLVCMNHILLMCCQAVLLTVPARSELYNVLGKDRTPENLSPGEVYTATADSTKEELDAQIGPWLLSLKDINGSIEKIYVSQGLEKVYGK